MRRRTFLQAAPGAAMAAAAGVGEGIRLGFDSYSIRSLEWKAMKLIDYAGSQKLDTLQISSLDDYESLEADHLQKVKDRANKLGMKIDGGIGCICPTSVSWSPKFGQPGEYVLKGLNIAKAIGATCMRCFIGTAADRRGKLPIDAHIESTIKVLRGVNKDGAAAQTEMFASGLQMPFGIAFYPPGPNPEWIYIGNTDSVVRFPYRNGDLKARGAQQVIVPDLPGGGRLRGGGHWTRDVVFSRDGKKMYVSVGSHSNNDDADNNPAEFHRADILEYNPDGSGLRVYAYGIRNAVGIAVQPETGQLWGSVNERDDLGDNLVPDYITHIQDGGFYGWPWFYMGGNQDPKHKGKHPAWDT